LLNGTSAQYRPFSAINAGMIYIKSNEHNITNNYNDKVKMILRSRIEANIKYVVTILYSAIKWDSLIKLIMFRAAKLSKRSFIEEAVKCLLRELILTVSGQRQAEHCCECINVSLSTVGLAWMPDCFVWLLTYYYFWLHKPVYIFSTM